MRENAGLDNQALLRQENQVMRYDAAVRRLFTAMPGGGAFDPAAFAADTGLRFSGERFFCVQLEDDPRYPSCPPKDEGALSPCQRYLELRNLVCGVLGRDQPAAVCNQSGRILCAVNWQGDTANWHGRCSELVEELNEALWQAHGFRFQCTVSRMREGIASLPQAARELDQARDYRTLMGGLPGELLFYDGILRTTGLGERQEDTARRSEERSQALRQALLQGSAQRARAILHTVLEEDFVATRPAVQFVQLRLFSVIDGLLKSLEYAAGELGIQEAWARVNAAPRLLEASGVWALERAAGELLEQFQSLAEEQGGIHRLPYQLRSYIREHCADPNLNVNQVADRFHVTATYATRVFKQAFGCGMLGYIQQLRVDRAKELLRDGQSVKEAAAAAGFTTSATLIRIFKKLEGTTPAQYAGGGD